MKASRRKRAAGRGHHQVSAQFPPSVRRRLQVAVDRTHKWKAEAPPFAQPRTVLGSEWDRLDRELVSAVRAGDTDRALRAVEDWENEMRDALKVSL